MLGIPLIFRIEAFAVRSEYPNAFGTSKPNTGIIQDLGLSYCRYFRYYIGLGHPLFALWCTLGLLRLRATLEGARNLTG